ncbi:MAG TPA: hydroxysqualene dehydroxylase HpnE [Vicinamibacterales bacterium]|nr:hydroxysqualene dehydroxylase HpnE [Vicinamibacterales bacterium]
MTEMNSMSPDVVVIGAGVAGLNAAVELSRRGARVSVLEAKAVLGGRATAFDDPQTGERVDNGQHVLLGCYRETFRLLDAIGTADRVRLQTSLDVEFVDRAGVRSRLRCPPLPAPFNLLGGLFEWDALDWRDRMAALKMARPIRIVQKEIEARSKGLRATLQAASAGETVEQWLIHNGQTARLREMLWEPLALAALNQSVREAAAPPFARVLGEMFGGDSNDAALGLPLCPLDELYADPARRYIEARRGDVRIGSPAKVFLEGDRVGHVETRGARVRAGATIVAVPWYALADIFTGDTGAVESLQRAAAATRPSPIASVNLWLDRRVLRTPFLGLPGRTLQWVFDKQQMFEDTHTSHVTMVSSGAELVMGLSNEELTEIALRELREALPEARLARVDRATVVRERRATFSLAPGQPPRPGVRTGVDRLFLAGDWIDTGLPATIEGAASSGRLAAEAVS